MYRPWSYMYFSVMFFFCVTKHQLVNKGGNVNFFGTGSLVYITTHQHRLKQSLTRNCRFLHGAVSPRAHTHIMFDMSPRYLDVTFKWTADNVGCRASGLGQLSHSMLRILYLKHRGSTSTAEVTRPLYFQPGIPCQTSSSLLQALNNTQPDLLTLMLLVANFANTK